MAITKVSKNMSIIASLSDLPNATDGLTPAQLKAKFDEGGESLKTYINNTLIPNLESIVDGNSGADNIGATSIVGLSGVTVQELLEALKMAVDTKSNTTDIYTRTALNNGQLDTRYFTELELQSTTDGVSGADKIGATPISTSPSTVQGILEWLKQQIDNTTLGQIPDGSLTDVKLSNNASDIKQRFSVFLADYINHVNLKFQNSFANSSMAIPSDTSVDLETEIEIVETGIYLVWGFVNFNESTGSNGHREIAVIRNGTSVLDTFYYNAVKTNGSISYKVIYVSGIKLSIGDKLRLRVLQNQGASLSSQGRLLRAAKIGDDFR